MPDTVLSSFNSNKPETLWAWMNKLRDSGATLLAIPHNANASDGMMFSLQNFAGKPMDDAYTETRERNEALMPFAVGSGRLGGIRKFHSRVIPAKAGIQLMHGLRPLWIPAFAGMTIVFYRRTREAHCCPGYSVCRRTERTTAQAGTQCSQSDDAQCQRSPHCLVVKPSLMPFAVGAGRYPKPPGPGNAWPAATLDSRLRGNDDRFLSSHSRRRE